MEAECRKAKKVSRGKMERSNRRENGRDRGAEHGIRGRGGNGKRKIMQDKKYKEEKWRTIRRKIGSSEGEEADKGEEEKEKRSKG